ncbi:hypothetical protein GpartN1_g2957.t1 [Galdieria partita]|uniref:Apicomplexan-conserved protein n=1 Tax=Galdieria partita TaxID=83374 RepID=A0A9C7PVH7_9RHOD|nr:hypothetical protein GpartN1_g2957.t1 [Galdieria partita]
MDTYTSLKGVWNMASCRRIVEKEVFFSSNDTYGLKHCSLECIKASGHCSKKKFSAHTQEANNEVEQATASKVTFRKGIICSRRRSLSLPTVAMNGNLQRPLSSFYNENHRCPTCMRREKGSEGVFYEFLNVHLDNEAGIFLAEEKFYTLSSRLSTKLRSSVMSDRLSRIRNRFLTCSQQSQKGVTLYLMDWDDTLFPSTALTLFESLECLPEELRNCLKRLEWTVILLLDALKRTGSVAIVTNANAEWVEVSCRNFMPKLFSRLQDLGILVLSARKLFGSDSVSPISNCPSDWKAAAFLRLMIHFFSSTATENSEILKLSEQGFSEDGIMSCLDQGRESRVERPPIYRLSRISRLYNHAVWFKTMHVLDCVHQTEQKRKNIVLDQWGLNQSNSKFEKAVLSDSNSFVCHHIVAMGDSCFEQNAINTLRAQYRKAHFKFIHFVSEPSITTLSLELKSVYAALQGISSFAGNLEIRFNSA